MDNVGEIERYTIHRTISRTSRMLKWIWSACCCVPNVKASVELLPRLTRKYAHRQYCTRLCRNHLLVRMRRRTGNITVRCERKSDPPIVERIDVDVSSISKILSRMWRTTRQGNTYTHARAHNIMFTYIYFNNN